MKKIQDRKVQVLKHIVEEYLKTGEIMGSKSLLQKYDLQVSSATIRNDMMALEKMGLIFQPYNSAGRLPTTRGLRVFVDYLMETMPAVFLEAEKDYKTRTEERRIDDTLYELVARLTKITGEITFACIPSIGTSYYLGLSNYLERHKWMLGEEMYQVIKCLENKHQFIDILQDLDIGDKVSVFIGEENIIPELETSTMIVKKIEVNGYEGYLGILGSTMMDYAFNITAMRQVL
jgi:transcriptional regulator of heat shock response